MHEAKLIKSSQKVRRCVGCDNFKTIGIGDPYYKIMDTHPDNDSPFFSMCKACYEHWMTCSACQQSGWDGCLDTVAECRKGYNG